MSVFLINLKNKYHLDKLVLVERLDKYPDKEWRTEVELLNDILSTSKRKSTIYDMYFEWRLGQKIFAVRIKPNYIIETRFFGREFVKLDNLYILNTLSNCIEESLEYGK